MSLPSALVFPRIGVFCGARPGAHSDYTAAAEALGIELAKRKLGLIFGGATTAGNGMPVSVGTQLPKTFSYPDCNTVSHHNAGCARCDIPRRQR